MRQSTQEEAIGLIKNAGCRIELVLQSFDGSNLPPDAGSAGAALSTQLPLKPALKNARSPSPGGGGGGERGDRSATPTSQADGDADSRGPTPQPQTQRVGGGGSSTSSSSDDDESEETSGKVTTKAGYEIDRKSAGNVKRSKEEIAGDAEPENNFGYTDRE